MCDKNKNNTVRISKSLEEMADQSTPAARVMFAIIAACMCKAGPKDPAEDARPCDGCFHLFTRAILEYGASDAQAKRLIEVVAAIRGKSKAYASNLAHTLERAMEGHGFAAIPMGEAILNAYVYGLISGEKALAETERLLRLTDGLNKSVSETN